MKSLKKKESLQESLNNLQEKVISMNKNFFSLNNKLIKKEENPWLINKKYKNYNKFLILAVNKPNKKSECLAMNSKEKEEKVW